MRYKADRRGHKREIVNVSLVAQIIVQPLAEQHDYFIEMAHQKIGDKLARQVPDWYACKRVEKRLTDRQGIHQPLRRLAYAIILWAVQKHNLCQIKQNVNVSPCVVFDDERLQ